MALKNQTQGIIMLVIAVLIWAPIPGFGLVQWDNIAALALLVLGLYNLFK